MQTNLIAFNISKESNKPAFFTLLLLISFASVNAVLFTPALPDMTRFFAISNNAAQQSISWFLIAYALGQLVYGPLTNCFGKKLTLYLGIGLQILSSLICILSGIMHVFFLLIIGRFLLALGSGVGLKMSFTLVNEHYDVNTANKKTAYLMLSFAITPGLATALGGILNVHFGWMSCFYAGAVYGVFLLFLVFQLPESPQKFNWNALKLTHLLHNYRLLFHNFGLVSGGFLMGLGTSFIYIFAALAPFIAINLLGMTSSQYGFANILPPIGILLGSFISPRLTKQYSPQFSIRCGIAIICLGVTMMFVTFMLQASALLVLFLPTLIIYLGGCFIIANASALAMSKVTDKAYGSAVMNFLNMGTATVLVLSLGFLSITALLLPLVYTGLCVIFIYYSRFLSVPLFKQN